LTRDVDCPSQLNLPEPDMITPDYVRLMARYNHWRNESTIAEAGQLTDAQRWQDQGLFFKTILGTLNHLIWADDRWLCRFEGRPLSQVAGADVLVITRDWDDFVTRRRALDQQISQWAEGVSQDWLDGTLHWQPTGAPTPFIQPHAVLVTHLFNHQTHHRGQVHAALTALGVKTAATDLPWMPSD
jgi:uncharacterized damage-inducible protein DinB